MPNLVTCACDIIAVFDWYFFPEGDNYTVVYLQRCLCTERTCSHVRVCVY